MKLVNLIKQTLIGLMVVLSTPLIAQSNDGNPKIYAPNSFTPNNDGINDIFFIKCDSISNSVLIIYDRTGSSIYNSSNLWWTGDSGSGFYCENGIYTWVLRFRNSDGFYDEKRGYVQLTR